MSYTFENIHHDPDGHSWDDGTPRYCRVCHNPANYKAEMHYAQTEAVYQILLCHTHAPQSLKKQCTKCLNSRTHPWHDNGEWNEEYDDSLD